MYSIMNACEPKLDSARHNKAAVLSIGRRIREARLSASLTQSELARRCKVTRGAVCNWEKDLVINLKNEHLYAVADATSVSARWLGTGKGAKSKSDALPPQILDALSDLSKSELKELVEYANFRFGKK